ncbi:MAG TPA: DUF6188 family protein [Mycobacterium sp.]|jgi:hypothetical protein|nr:DUF6188 family protein [Mycobacterium sp.]
MITQWIENCSVQRIGLRGGLVLNLDDDNELVITRPFHLHLPPVGRFSDDTVDIDPMAVPDYERPLLDFSGAVCTHAEVEDDGTLRLTFAGGHGIEVPPDEQQVAWELYGKRHGFMVCLPGGCVRVVRHDDNAALNTR